MSKKIAIITPAYPLRGGIAASGERLAKAFQAEGNEVDIFSFSLQYPNFLFPGKTQFSDDAPPVDLTIHTTINSIQPLSWFSTAHQIINYAPDIIVCRFWLPFMAPSTGTILRRVKKKIPGVRIIGLIDNIVPHEKRFGDKQLAQYFAYACDGFVVMSRSVEKEMLSFTEKRVVYIPHPIYDTYGEKTGRDASLKYLNLPTDKRYILFFGFVRKYKGLDILLEALTDVDVRALNLTLLVAGEFYDDAQTYRDYINLHQLADNVIIKSDFIASDAVRYYFGAADAVVQPYRTATQSGISQMAYHFETPMIVTNVGGLSEIIPNGKVGFVVEPNADAIKQALIAFYKTDRNIFVEGVADEKKRFSWENMTSAILDIGR